MPRPSPGELVAIFGINLANGSQSAPSLPLSDQMQGTELFLAGRPLPLVYISPNQINAMMPYGITPGSTYQLVATRGNRLALPQPVTVAAAEPAIFTTTANGLG